MDEMKVIPVTEIEVINTITTLKRKNTSGHDDVSNKILKHCVNLITKPFTYICNFSLISGIYPEMCTHAFV